MKVLKVGDTQKYRKIRRKAEHGNRNEHVPRLYLTPVPVGPARLAPADAFRAVPVPGGAYRAISHKE